MVQRVTGLVPITLLALLTLGACSGPPAPGDTSQEAAADSGAAGEASPAAPAGEAARPAGPFLRIVELNGWYRAALVERAATRNPRDLAPLARSICAELTVCRVGVWTDEWSMPNAMPVRAPQLEAQEFAFGRNAKGEETALWNCNKYPEFEAEGACLPRLLK